MFAHFKTVCRSTSDNIGGRMRTSVLMVAAVAFIASRADAQGPWGNVKTWTGTVTIEAVDSRKGQGSSSLMSYKATGNFTISDDMLPDGSHMQWPMPSVEAMSDPKQATSAYERWQARVVATYEDKGVGESGQPFTVTCAADNRTAPAFGVTINTTAPSYVVNVSS